MERSKRHRWTEAEKDIVRASRHLPASLIQRDPRLRHVTVKAVQRAKDQLRGEDLPLNGVPLSADEEAELLLNIDRPNSVLSAMFRRKPDDMDRHVNRLRAKHGLPRTRRTKNAERDMMMSDIRKSIRPESAKAREPKNRTEPTPETKVRLSAAARRLGGKMVQRNAAAPSPIKRAIGAEAGRDELQLLHALEVIKNADPAAIERIRSRRRQKEDNSEIVAIWDLMCLPQAKDLSSSSWQRTLCKKLRIATERHNRALRALPEDKSANVSTFQYNFIRHVCGIRVTSFTDHKIHGNLGLELRALTSAIDEVYPGLAAATTTAP
jgi:hypothetical protein